MLRTRFCAALLGSAAALVWLSGADAQPQRKDVERLVADLGSQQLKVREEAFRQLESMGYPVLDLLAQLMQKADADIRRRCDKVRANIEFHLCDAHLIHVLEGHKDRVNQVRVTHDGKLIVSAGWDQALRVWEIKQGALIRTLEGHGNSVHCVALSADGKKALSGGKGTTPRLWDLNTGKSAIAWEGQKAEVWEVAFSPDGGQALCAAADGSLKLWNLATGRVAKDFGGHPTRIWSAAFSPDGNRIASGGGKVLQQKGDGKAPTPDFAIRLWDAAKGKELSRFTGHTADVRRVRFSADGTRLVSASFDSTVRVWDVETGKELQCFKGHHGFVEDALFTPDGKTVISCEGSQLKDGKLAFEGTADRLGEPAIRFWEVATGKEWMRLRGHGAAVLSMALTPDGEHLISSSADRTVRVWRMPKQK